ncbi:hypothetical protein BTE77_28155 [Ensifer adhaerens]|nr:hypothetical protein BTE77_28155 [Ensifer adhaerens]
MFGGTTYRLHLPSNPAAKQFWSLTSYVEGARQIVLTKQGGRTVPRPKIYRPVDKRSQCLVLLRNPTKRILKASLDSSTPARRHGRRPSPAESENSDSYKRLDFETA